MVFRFIPKYLVRKLVGFRIIIDYQALEVLRCIVHDSTERLQRREHTGIILPNTLPICQIWLSQYKHVINIGTQVGWDTQWILHRYN
jgi:hypothetical protein